MEQAFKMFDTDSDGFITREELETIMGGVPMDEMTWKAILEESDINKDGKVINQRSNVFFIQETDLERRVCASIAPQT